jgi:hypothetical protein
LLYGVGRFLRSTTFKTDRLIAPTWTGTSIPQKTMRGIYFATHFHNFYHDAPIEEVERYVQDLALWGYNTVNVWFDMHHFNGISDPDAQVMIARLHAILRAANQIGIGACLAFLSNEGYANSPAELRADWTAGHDGYHHEPAGHYHVELCPSKPGAPELLLKWVDEKLSAFSDVTLDALWIWPYDQGGCTCGNCAPWGVNGFLKMAEPIARHYKQAFPAGKVVLSTWYFDHFTDGEWVGLSKAFTQRPDWVDYLMVDDYGDVFPQYPLEHGAPGGLPMVNFPEISMYRCNPWGGYGANPLPRHLQHLWDCARENLTGGFPYSEGIYEDINKAIFAQFYWDQTQAAMTTLREYAAFEFSSEPAAIDAIVAAIEILERNNAHTRETNNDADKLLMPSTEGADEAYRLLRDAETTLSPQARDSWRWRVLFLRAMIDAELAAHDFAPTQKCYAAFEELTRIYHARHAETWVAPPRLME